MTDLTLHDPDFLLLLARKEFRFSARRGLEPGEDILQRLVKEVKAVNTKVREEIAACMPEEALTPDSQQALMAVVRQLMHKRMEFREERLSSFDSAFIAAMDYLYGVQSGVEPKVNEARALIEELSSFADRNDFSLTGEKQKAHLAAVAAVSSLIDGEPNADAYREALATASENRSMTLYDVASLPVPPSPTARAQL